MNNTHYNTLALLNPKRDDYLLEKNRSKRLKKKLSTRYSITLFALFVLSFCCYLTYKVSIKRNAINQEKRKSHMFYNEQVFNTLIGFKLVDDLKSDKILSMPLNKDKDPPSGLIYLDNPKAYALLIDSTASFHQYFLYNSRGFDVQINQAFCGLATAAAVMNSLRSVLTVPQDPIYSPYLYATQNDLVNECVSRRAVLSSDAVLSPPYGLTLSQVQDLLKCWLPRKQGWVVKMKYVTKESKMENVKRDLIRMLNGGTSRVLVNYNRQMLGQIGGGHFSPLVAYNPKEDLFLINDVAKYKYAPVFVPFSKLYQAMKTIDSCGNWNFPKAQNKLHDFNFTASAISSDSDPAALESVWDNIKHTLGCEVMFRGYITIKKNSV